jgi:predicted DCC family thiol-disulfide oxidoreductase YuxK
MAELTLLFDGGCPLCLREVNSLRRRDAGAGRLAFVDVNDPAYDPSRHGGITYANAMGRMHALRADGTVIRDVEVFRQAYTLVNLGWLYAPTGWPLLRPLVDALYGLWARWRLAITGRPSLEVLCRERCAIPSSAALEPQTPAQHLQPVTRSGR